MSFLENVRQTISEAASTAIDVGQNLSVQAQAQVNLRRLQLDQAKKFHELGAKTHTWHKSGALVVSGNVPREIHELCGQIDDLQRQMDAEQLRLEEARREAEARNAPQVLPGEDEPTYTANATITNTPMNPAATSGAPGTWDVNAVSASQTPAHTPTTTTSAPSANRATSPLPTEFTPPASYAPAPHTSSYGANTGAAIGPPGPIPGPAPSPAPGFPGSTPQIPNNPDLPTAPTPAPGIPGSPSPVPSSPTMPGTPTM